MSRGAVYLYFLFISVGLASPAAPALARTAPAPGTLTTTAIEKLLPAEYWKRILPDAKRLAAARARLAANRKDTATVHGLFRELARKSSFQDIALFDLASLELDRLHDPKGARAHLQALLIEHPGSALVAKAEERLAEAEIAAGAKLAAQAKKQKASARAASREEAAVLLRRGLDRLGWKEWDAVEKSVALLLDLYRESHSPLFEGFYGEALNALSSNSQVRADLMKRIPADSRERVLRLARHSPGANGGGRGTKPIQPDDELFRNAFEKVLDAKWAEALETFETFKSVYPDSQEMDRVEYWIAACREALGKKEEANADFERIFRSSTLAYYGLESALRAGIPLGDAVGEGPSFIAEIEGNLLPRQLELLWRARALSQVGLFADARRDMDALFRYSPGGVRFGQADARGSLALAILFSENRYFQGAFFHLRAALQKDPSLLSRESLAIFFPNAFQAEFAPVAKAMEIDPLLLLSVAKQESAFNPEAFSSARALGLMQVLLSTATEIQDNLDKKRLLEPGRNVRIGGEYLAKLLRQFDGNIALALAGYNAGPGRARRWWNELSSRPIFAQGFRADAFIEAIPFKETRGYVASILRNYAWYKFLNGAEIPASVDKLAQIAPAAPALPAAAANDRPLPAAATAATATETAAPAKPMKQ